MKNIYHIHQSSNSYWESHWTEENYYLCDSEEEYQQLLAEYKNKRKNVVERYEEAPEDWCKKWCFNNFIFLEEDKVHANEYYYGHEWCGKSFNAYGFGWFERRERSSHYKYFLKPDSVTGENESDAVGRFTGYGS